MMKARYLAIVIMLSMPAPTSARNSPNPWFGTWVLRLQAPGEKPETLTYSDAGPGAMRMVSQEENSVIVTRFDGKPSPDLGRRNDGRPVLAVKAMTPTRYSWTFFRDGKPYVRGINTLAADHRSFTEVSWLITKPRETVTLVYDRR